MTIDKPWQDRIFLNSVYIHAVRIGCSNGFYILPKLVAQQDGGLGYELIDVSAPKAANPCEYVGYKPLPETVRMLFKLLMGVL